MKIAILTQPLRINYGGILQAYALQTILQRMGHEVVVINREYGYNLSIKLLCLRLGAITKSIIRKYILGKKEYIIMTPFSPVFRTKWDGYIVQPFVKKRIVQSPEFRNSESMMRYFTKQKFDCYIVGSDQVWRPCYSPCITDFFLKSVPDNSNAKRIAYAASFGTDKWEFSEDETKECAFYARMFDAVSVREKSGIKLCEENLGINAVHLLDPTMLLDKEDYLRLFDNTDISIRKGNLFCYFLDKNQELDRIVSSLKIDGYIPNYAYLSVQSTEENPRPYQLSVEEWMRGIYDSELVVTDSFHGCVFSILFNKPFIVVGNNYRGRSRFDSLLDMFGLQNRMVESYECFLKKKESLIDDSDIRAVEKTLDEARVRSAIYLKSAIYAHK